MAPAERGDGVGARRAEPVVRGRERGEREEREERARGEPDDARARAGGRGAGIRSVLGG